MLAGMTGAVSSKNNDCSTSYESPTSSGSVSSGDGSIEGFVKEHKEAYILSWKAGGYLPSLSITQTMVENGFNFTNPNGTSFWKAHNMGGVKTSKRSDFPVTLETYGEDSVDLTGTKPGTNVGDNTGGAYTWFSSYDAGIVGKAEFMAHQTLYTKAINNTNAFSAAKAIAEGGWASDPVDYNNKLISMYEILGAKYKWLDQEAIAAHGENPYKGTQSSTSQQNEQPSSSTSDLPSDVSADSWELVLVNRENVRAEMNPNLASVGSIQVDSRIASTVQTFLSRAQEINSAFHLISGYRSVETQRSVYDGYVRQEMAERGISYEEAEKYVQVYSQPPGASEHQTGLAIDISTHNGLNEMSDADDAALEKLGVELGFIRHFKQEYKSSTGIGDEDWHYRYVGVASAKYIYEKKISFEDYIKKLKSSGGSVPKTDECEDYRNGGNADGTGVVPAGATAWGYAPDNVPDSLKSYIIDPKTYGMGYGSSQGWHVTGQGVSLDGQCVNLTISLANHIWEHKGGVPGNGKDMANAWATIFKNSVKSKPKKGAIFATQVGGGGFGHTGIVCHVFEDGSILLVEQNTPLSGIDSFGKAYTWNYRIMTPPQQKLAQISFAYPDGKEPKLG